MSTEKKGADEAPTKPPKATAIATTAAHSGLGRTLVPIESIETLEKLAEKLARSNLLPNDLASPDKAFVALMTAGELGLPLMRGAQGMAVIGGRACVWGETHRALALTNNPNVEWTEEYWLVDGEEVDVLPSHEWPTRDKLPDSLTFVSKIKTVQNKRPTVGQFSIADAKRIEVYEKGKTKSLWEKSGPWANGMIFEMLQARARRAVERQACPDKVSGIMSAENAADIGPRDAEFTVQDDPGQTKTTIDVDAVKPAEEKPKPEEKPEEAKDHDEKATFEIVQEMKKAFEASGMDPARFLKLCKAQGIEVETMPEAWAKIASTLAPERCDEFLEVLRSMEKDPTSKEAPTGSQIEQLKALRQEGSIPDAVRKRILKDLYGVDQVGKLSKSQAQELIEGLKDGSTLAKLAELDGGE